MLQHESRPPKGLAMVRAAVTLIHNLAHRVGAVPAGAVLPDALRRQRWSPLNVPQLVGAAVVEQSLSLLFDLVDINRLKRSREPFEFHGSHTSASGVGFVEGSSHEVVGHQLLSEQLTTWLRSHGFHRQHVLDRYISAQ